MSCHAAISRIGPEPKDILAKLEALREGRERIEAARRRLEDADLQVADEIDRLERLSLTVFFAPPPEVSVPPRLVEARLVDARPIDGVWP